MSNPLLPANTHTHTAPAEIRDFDAAVDANTDVNLNKLHREDDTTNPHMTTATQVGLGFVPNVKQNLSAGTAPLVTDDSSQGYSVGSRWIDGSANLEYVCIDATVGAAVWVSRPVTVSPLGNPWEAIVMNQAATAPVANPRMIIGAQTGGVQNTSGFTTNNLSLIGVTPAISGGTISTSQGQIACMASDLSIFDFLGDVANSWITSKSGINNQLRINPNNGPQFSFRTTGSAAIATFQGDMAAVFNVGGGTNQTRSIRAGEFQSGFGGGSFRMSSFGNIAVTAGGAGASSNSVVGRCNRNATTGTNNMQGSFNILMNNGFIMGGGARASTSMTIGQCRAQICSAATFNAGNSQIGALFTHNGNLNGPLITYGAVNQAASFCTTNGPTANNQVNANDVLWETQTILSDVDTKTDITPIEVPQDYAAWRDAFQTVQPKAFRLIEQSSVEPELRGFDAAELQAAFPLTVLSTSLDKRRVTRNERDTAWIDENGQECDETYIDVERGLFVQNAPREFLTLDTVALLQTMLVTAQQQTAKLAALTQLLAV